MNGSYRGFMEEEEEGVGKQRPCRGRLGPRHHPMGVVLKRLGRGRWWAGGGGDANQLILKKNSNRFLSENQNPGAGKMNLKQ